MDFKNASLDELKQFVKEHKIKGVSALRKSALIEFLEKNYNGETDHTAGINEVKLPVGEDCNQQLPEI